MKYLVFLVLATACGGESVKEERSCEERVEASEFCAAKGLGRGLECANAPRGCAYADKRPPVEGEPRFYCCDE